MNGNADDEDRTRSGGTRSTCTTETTTLSQRTRSARGTASENATVLTRSTAREVQAGSRVYRGYGILNGRRYPYVKLKAYILLANPACTDCGNAPSTEVDHIRRSPVAAVTMP